MDTTTSTQARQGRTSELEKFQLFYEFVPVPKAPGRVKRTNASAH